MTQQQKNRTAIYCRLSRDDGDGESMSILNQREMLSRYANENGFSIYKIYIDDGYSGTNFERPQFKQMIADIENGLIDVVITKDLSRLGREYLQTGSYIEIFFPANNVRYIAGNDGVDTSTGENEFLGIKNIINEFYAKDTSRKVRSARISLAKQGKYLAPVAPYGYQKSPADKHILIPDEVTAPIVKRMFRMAKEGMVPYQIANTFKNEKILMPIAYTAKTTGRYKTKYDNRYPYDWQRSTIAAMLRNKVYIGTLVNHKRTFHSFKNKQLLDVPKEEWIEVEGTHEPLIDRETWDIVQKMVSVKKKYNLNGEKQIFAGLLKCPDCAWSLSFVRGRGNGSFTCNYAKSKGTSYCSWHSISYNALYAAVSADIKKHIELLKSDRAKFEAMLAKQMNMQNKKQLDALIKEQRRLSARLDELKKVIRTLYEDKALSKISAEEYETISEGCLEEKRNAETRLGQIKEQLATEKECFENVGHFTSVVEKYLDFKELDRVMLNELIEKIEVHEAEKIDGVKRQKIDVYYRFVGNITPYDA